MEPTRRQTAPVSAGLQDDRRAAFAGPPVRPAPERPQSSDPGAASSSSAGSSHQQVAGTTPAAVVQPVTEAAREAADIDARRDLRDNPASSSASSSSSADATFDQQIESVLTAMRRHFQGPPAEDQPANSQMAGEAAQGVSASSSSGVRQSHRHITCREDPLELNIAQDQYERFQAAVASGASFETPEGYSNWESNVFNRCIHYEESVPLPSVREGNQQTREWVIDMHLLAWELSLIHI